jgi:hypothetical protein
MADTPSPGAFEQRGIVNAVNVQEDWTIIQLTLDGQTNPADWMLRNSHDAYASIFTLLISSGASRRKISLYSNDSKGTAD